MKRWAEKLKGHLKGKLVAGVLIILVLLTSIAGMWEKTELGLYDTWFILRGPLPAPQDVAVIAIDDKSIGEIGLLPWPRKVNARLLEALKEAKAVGFDEVFDTPGTPEDNASLAAAMKAQGKVVLAFMYSVEQSGGNSYLVRRFPVKQLAAAAAGIGFINTPEDIDNTVRRINVLDTNERPIPCFSLAVLQAARGSGPNPRFSGPSTLDAGGLHIPFDKKNQTLINFWGPGSTVKTYSYVDVLKGRVSPDEFAGKIVLIGPTSAADQDFKNTPFTRGNMVLGGAPPTPGVEVHASAVATYLTGSFYKRASLPVNLAILLFIGALSSFAVSRAGNPLRGLFLLLAIMGGATAGVFLSWYYGHYWLNLASPLGLAALIYTGITAENLVRTELERRRTRALFARYVSSTVVEELLQHQEEIVLGGARMDLTVLFSDIRGFTSFSENKQPEYIVQRLNEYFTEMTAVIFKYGGTLDKYLGDGMMVFFGAPIHYEDHADRALAASLEMLERLRKLNKKWQEQGEPTFDIGVGINSGPVVVGNVGSPERMDYTIMGGDVNLAARLESMNKEYKTKIIFSDRTLKYLKRKEDLPGEIVFLGEANVRGMVETVGIYTVEAEKSEVM